MAETNTPVNDTNTPHPLDLSRYEGIEREKWTWTDNQASRTFPINRFLCAEPTSEHPGGYGVVQHAAYWDIPPEFRNLLADAPLLLAEVKRLRAALGFAHAAMIREREKHTKPPTLLRDAINHARRVLGEEVGGQ